MAEFDAQAIGSLVMCFSTAPRLKQALAVIDEDDIDRWMSSITGVEDPSASVGTRGLVPYESLSEHNLLADASKIVETNKTKIEKGKDVCVKFVTESLQSLGYDASICKSKWDKTPSILADALIKFFDDGCSIMNLIGVLKFKKMGEDFVRNSSLPYTIIRAERLTDGPYTSYDLNTLIKATAGERRLTDGPYTSYDLNTLIKATAGERGAVVIGQGGCHTPLI
ncbi:uncharacterized protein A4U43_C01F26110 [Asparagus officinalis]|uniref:NAD(P)-binding domain-containing protein n=1 Tax=Asparagus officinalis TaxID=4686 RepID=A0A5P1FU24_ASPOF|nr:uncharacterized protein A4U43_C01F26110 [Asparagus officinalis]